MSRDNEGQPPDPSALPKSPEAMAASDKQAVRYDLAAAGRVTLLPQFARERSRAPQPFTAGSFSEQMAVIG